MRTTTKWIVAGLAVAALAGVGVAAAASQHASTNATDAADHGKGKGRGPGPFAVFRVCQDDNMTIGQCKDLVKQKLEDRIDRAYQKCLTKHDQSFCDAKKTIAEDRLQRIEARWDHGADPGQSPDPTADS